MLRNDFSRLFDLLAEAHRLVEIDDARVVHRLKLLDVPPLAPEFDCNSAAVALEEFSQTVCAANAAAA